MEGAVGASETGRPVVDLTVSAPTILRPKETAGKPRTLVLAHTHTLHE